ncbi:MAG: BlaI/MecI/CopY family transcriptional regulator [Pirellulaceae bacterium]
MVAKKLPKPTEAELAILQVLWKQGPSTVRQVQDCLADRGTGYTTTLKLMQIMFEKGLLKRDESERSHVYTSAVPQTRTQKQLVSQLIDQVFDGSAQQLVMQALSSRKASADELAEIRALLDSIERGQS